MWLYVLCVYRICKDPVVCLLRWLAGFFHFYMPDHSVAPVHLKDHWGSLLPQSFLGQVTAMFPILKVVAEILPLKAFCQIIASLLILAGISQFPVKVKGIWMKYHLPIFPSRDQPYLKAGRNALRPNSKLPIWKLYMAVCPAQSINIGFEFSMSCVWPQYWTYKLQKLDRHFMQWSRCSLWRLVSTDLSWQWEHTISHHYGTWTNPNNSPQTVFNTRSAN